MKKWIENLIIYLMLMLYRFIYVSFMTWLICCTLGVECTIRITSATFLGYIMVHNASYWARE